MNKRACCVLFLSLLASAIVIHAEGPEKMQPVFRDVLIGKYEDAKSLIEQGADVNAVDGENGDSILIIMAAKSPFDHASWMLQYLIEKKANVNFQNKFGTTALMTAASVANQENVSLLLQAGANLNLTTRAGETALMLAAKNRSLPILQSLIQARSNLDAQTVSKFRYPAGSTALMIAAKEKISKNIQELIQAGANTKLVDESGKTAWIISYDNKDNTSLDLFRQNVGKEVDESILRYAASKNDLQAVRSFIQNGVDVNSADSYGVSAAMSAAMYKHHEVYAALVKSGAKKLAPGDYIHLISSLKGTSKDLRRETFANMMAISTACTLYFWEKERYPAGSSGKILELKKQLEPEYIGQMPMKDSWGKEFSYYSPASNDRFILQSAGANGKNEETFTNGDALDFLNGKKKHDGKPFSFDFRKIETEDTLAFIGDISGLEYNKLNRVKKIGDPDPLPKMQGELGVYLQEAPWDLTLDMVALSNGFVYHIEDEKLHVDKIKDFDDLVWVASQPFGEVYPVR
jgi:ankyrin repeat protein